MDSLPACLLASRASCLAPPAALLLSLCSHTYLACPPAALLLPSAGGQAQGEEVPGLAGSAEEAGGGAAGQAAKVSGPHSAAGRSARSARCAAAAAPAGPAWQRVGALLGRRPLCCSKAEGWQALPGAASVPRCGAAWGSGTPCCSALRPVCSPGAALEPEVCCAARAPLPAGGATTLTAASRPKRTRRSSGWVWPGRGGVLGRSGEMGLARGHIVKQLALRVLGEQLRWKEAGAQGRRCGPSCHSRCWLQRAAGAAAVRLRAGGLQSGCSQPL